MRFDRLRLATKLWSAMGLMVLVLTVIIGLTGYHSRKSREAYGVINATMLGKIRAANEWAALVDVNSTRAYAVVVAVDPGVANAFKAPIAESNAKIEALQQAIEAANPSDADKRQLEKIAVLRKTLQDLTSQTALLKVTQPRKCPPLWKRSTAQRCSNCEMPIRCLPPCKTTPAWRCGRVLRPRAGA